MYFAVGDEAEFIDWSNGACAESSRFGDDFGCDAAFFGDLEIGKYWAPSSSSPLVNEWIEITFPSKIECTVSGIGLFQEPVDSK